MIFLFQLIIRQLFENIYFDKSLRKYGADTKKCIYCLKKFDVDLVDCPYCGYKNNGLFEE